MREIEVSIMPSKFFSSSYAKVGGEGNGNPLQYSRLENSVDRPGGLLSMGSYRVGHD